MIGLSRLAQQLGAPSNENDPAERPRKVDDKFRAYRRRQRLGLKVFHLELDEFAVIAWLIENGLTDEQALDPALVGAVLAKYLTRAAAENFRYR